MSQVIRGAGRLVVMLWSLASLGASCGQTGLAIMPGVVNNPGNRTLRRELFNFAVDSMCQELLGRSVPLKLRDEDPAIGRFFPTGCSIQQMTEGNIFVSFTGHGYGWSNVTGRMGFEASAAVEYDHDFLMDGSTMYVYLRQQKTQSSAFRLLWVEREQGPAGDVAGVMGTNVQAVTQQVGERLLQHELARGMTVVREDDGTTTFAMGVLEQGASTPAPFGRGESDWPLLANERVEIHHGQRDFTGPYLIEDEDDTLWLTVLVEGAPGADVLVVPKPVGDTWLNTYERGPASPPPGPALIDDVIAAPAAPGQPPHRRPLRLPVGQYYVVFDNSAEAGRSAPPAQAGDDRAALVSYAVQLGDPP